MDKVTILALTFGAIFTSNVIAATVEESVSHLQTQWADIKYQQAKDSREKQFGLLADDSKTRLEEHPNSAEIKIWRAIVLSSQAGEKGGLGALSLVKEAKTLLEEAIDSNPEIMGGSAETTLGSLYYQVPGWPIGFGSDKKAEALLKKGLEINPDGIDSNFWYASYLIDKKLFEETRPFLEKVLAADGREGRDIADKGRKKEATRLLNKYKLLHN